MRRTATGLRSYEERAESADAPGAPGKRPLTAALARPSAPPGDGALATEAPPVVQRRAHDAAPDDPFALHLVGDRGGGQVLPDAIRPGLERSFGMDLGGVRVHPDSGEAQALGAHAFARGADLHFAPGRYDATGDPFLVAHEVAHVAQQAEGRVHATVQARGVSLNADPALEHEADRMAAEAVAGRPARQGSWLAPVAGRVAQGFFDDPDAAVSATRQQLGARHVAADVLRDFDDRAADQGHRGTLQQFLSDHGIVLDDGDGASVDLLDPSDMEIDDHDQGDSPAHDDAGSHAAEDDDADDEATASVDPDEDTDDHGGQPVPPTVPATMAHDTDSVDILDGDDASSSADEPTPSSDHDSSESSVDPYPKATKKLPPKKQPRPSESHDSSSESSDSSSESYPKVKKPPAKKKRPPPSSSSSSSGSQPRAKPKSKASAKKKKKVSSSSSDSEADADRFLAEVADTFTAHRRDSGADNTSRYRSDLLQHTTQAHRDLDRLAWVLEKLKANRVCVAIGRADQEYYLFANQPDDDLQADFDLVTSATLDEAKLERLIKRMLALPSGCRLKKTQENKAKRKAIEKAHHRLLRRRSHKAVRGLRRLSSKGALSGTVPHLHVKRPIHAEQQGTGYAHQRGVRYDDMGISKLCCAKCWMALEAAERQSIHRNLATGAHWKTYATDNGWPIPPHIEDDDAALAAMVGKKAFKHMKDNRRACLKLLEQKALNVKGANTTDIVSSGEEYDDLEARKGQGSSKKPKKK